MAYELNGAIRGLIPYEPIRGEYAVRLDANESFCRVPEETVLSAVRETLHGGANRYPDPDAARVCGAFGRLYGVRPELLTAGNGSDELISLLVGVFLSPGEVLATLDCDFSMYRFYGETNQVKTTVLPKNADFTINAEQTAEAVRRSGARCLLFSNPCNPSSLCLSRERVLALVRAVPDCLVVVDEAYMDFSDQSVLAWVEELPNLIVLRTCSKALGMASLRLGFAAANPTLTRALRAVKSPYNVNALTQSVAAHVLEDGEYLAVCREAILKSRDCLYAGVTVLCEKYAALEEVYPTAANFVFVRTKLAGEIFEALLWESIAVRRMGEFLRITAGAPEENEALLAAMETIAAGLSPPARQPMKSNDATVGYRG